MKAYTIKVNMGKILANFVCASCLKPFQIGDRVVSIAAGHYRKRIRHEKCYNLVVRA